MRWHMSPRHKRVGLNFPKAIITYGARGADFNQKKPSWGALASTRIYEGGQELSASEFRTVCLKLGIEAGSSGLAVLFFVL